MKKFLCAGLSLLLMSPSISYAAGAIPEDVYGKLSAVLDIQEKLDRNESINYGDYSILFPNTVEFKSKVEYKRDRNSSQMTINLMGAENLRYTEEAGSITFEITQEVLEKNGLLTVFGQGVDIGDRLLYTYEYFAPEHGNSAKLTLSLRENVSYTINQNAYGIIVSLSKNASVVPKIVIDAGHGAHDLGAISKITGVSEKTLTLRTALALRDVLTEKGYEVILTRDWDFYPTNPDRAKMANEVDADIFVSIHYNSATSSKVHGLETFAYNTPDNNLLAEPVHRSLIASTGANNRGIKVGDKLIVLNSTKVPAILVELGFLSNPDEARRVLTESHQEVLVRALAAGIDNYFGRN